MRALAAITTCLLLCANIVQADPKILHVDETNSISENAPVTASVSEEKSVPEEGYQDYNIVVLQGLNKVTGHISKIQGPVGSVLTFGTLGITASRCWKSAPEDQPENAALLEIRENRPTEGPKKIFLGWMFSSSPGISGLEHPVYDITVLSCEPNPVPDKPEPALQAKEPKETKTVKKPAPALKKGK